MSRHDTGAEDARSDGMRLDRWLWAARFFKTRSLAAESVSGGKVHLNGARVKPARHVRPGDRLAIQRGPEEYVVVVRAIAAQRRGAPEAAELYAETAESARRRAERAADARAARERDEGGRPSKKDRRARRRFTGH